MTAREELKRLNDEYLELMSTIKDGKATIFQQEKVLIILGKIQFFSVRVMLFGNEKLSCSAN